MRLKKKLALAEKQGFAQACALYPEVQAMNWPLVTQAMKASLKKLSTVDLIDTYMLVRPEGSYYRSDNPGNPALEGMVSGDNADPQASPTLLTGRDYFEHVVIQNPQGAYKTFVANPNLSRSTGQKQIIVAATVQNLEGRNGGLFALLLNGNTLNRLLDVITGDLYTHFGSQASLFLISRSGSVAAIREYDPALSRYAEKALHINEEITLEDLSPSLVEALKGIQEGDALYTLFTQETTRNVYAMTKAVVPGTDYAVVLSIPDKVLYAALYNMKLIVLFFLAGLILVVVIVTFILNTRMVTPIAHTAATLHDISRGSGDLTQRLTVIGNDAVTEVSTYFNMFIRILQDLVRELMDQEQRIEAISQEIEQSSAHITWEVSAIIANIQQLHTQTEEQGHVVGDTLGFVRQITGSIDTLSKEIKSQTAGIIQSSAAVHQMVKNIMAISQHSLQMKALFQELISASENGKHNLSQVKGLVQTLSRQSKLIRDESATVNADSAGILKAMNRLEETSRHIQQGTQEIAQFTGNSNKTVTRITEASHKHLGIVQELHALTARFKV